jgi:dihydropteroate synthase
MRPQIVGIVNVTPDSFSDGGAYLDPARAVDHGLALIAEGADILDIGGESTRPGARPVAPEEEIRRILPVVEKLAQSGRIISVDTRNAETMRAAIRAGAAMINDISALTGPGSLEAVTDSDAKICLMHMQGEPQSMQNAPRYDDAVAEIIAFLDRRIAGCIEAGIDHGRLIVDPGIGFGKTLAHNIAILRHLDAFRALGVPLLLGASRKKFIAHLAGDRDAQSRLGGSLASALWAFAKGVDYIRVHDVFETRQALDVWRALAAEEAS